MSANVVIDAEVVPVLDRPAAERLDRRIRLMVDAINDNLAKLQALVDEAKRGDIHAALGYPSWTAYLADVFTVQARLDRDQRRELVGYLSGEGMSNRAIADLVGVDEGTVRNDQKARAEFSARDPHRVVTDTLGRQQPASKPPRPQAETEPTDAECIHCHQTLPIAELYEGGQGYECDPCVNPGDETEPPQPAPASGTCRDCDGHGCETCYPADDDESEISPGLTQSQLDELNAPAPQRDPAPAAETKPRRRPITDAFWTASFDLGKAVGRVERLATDDRFEKNKDQIARNLSDLVRARDALQRVIEKFN